MEILTYALRYNRHQLKPTGSSIYMMAQRCIFLNQYHRMGCDELTDAHCILHLYILACHASCHFVVLSCSKIFIPISLSQGSIVYVFVSYTFTPYCSFGVSLQVSLFV